MAFFVVQLFEKAMLLMWLSYQIHSWTGEAAEEKKKFIFNKKRRILLLRWSNIVSMEAGGAGGTQLEGGCF